MPAEAGAQALQRPFPCPGAVLWCHSGGDADGSSKISAAESKQGDCFVPIQWTDVRQRRPVPNPEPASAECSVRTQRASCVFCKSGAVTRPSDAPSVRLGVFSQLRSTK